MGCFGCLRYILFIFAALYIIVGLGLLAVALWLRFDYLKDAVDGIGSITSGLTGDIGPDFFKIALYVAMGVGGFLVLLGIFGTCGVLRVSLCLLANFAVMVVAAIGGLIAVCVLAYVYQDQIMHSGDSVIRKVMQTYDPNPQASRFYVQSKALDGFQRLFQCCGASSPRDWDYTPFKVIPQSCCRNPNGCDLGPNGPLFSQNVNVAPIMANQIFNQGCSDKIRTNFKQAMQIIVGSAGGIAGFMLLGFVFAIAFCCVM